MPDPVRIAAGLPIGGQGGYFVGSMKDCGQEETHDVIDYNNPPNGQPEIWCQWTPTEDGTAIEWNGMEKFCNYVEWIKYLITHFLAPWGYVLAGSVEWQGEESSDKGRLVISNNVVRTQKGKTVYR